MKQKLVIFSSKEGLSVAEALQQNLHHSLEITLWTQRVFGLSETTLDSILHVLSENEFAVLVLTPDDKIERRDVVSDIPRDNVIFELGLSIGSLGKDRVFFVCPETMKMNITDLVGITFASYDPTRSDENLSASLGVACTQIKHSIAKVGPNRIKKEIILFLNKINSEIVNKLKQGCDSISVLVSDFYKNKLYELAERKYFVDYFQFHLTGGSIRGGGCMMTGPILGDEVRDLCGGDLTGFVFNLNKELLG